MLRQLLILFFSLFFVSSLLAVEKKVDETGIKKQDEKTFYQDHKKGWYWYEQFVKEKEEKEKEEKKEKKAERKLPSLKDYPKEKLWKMHPDDLKSLLSEFHKKTIMEPTESNMYEYLVVLDIVRRRSLAVANLQMATIQKYPDLDVGPDYPITSPGRKSFLKQRFDEIESKINKEKNNFGLIYFYSPNCSYCSEQSNILNYFVDKYKWETKRVDIEKNTKAASRFNIQRVPFIIIVSKKSGDYYPISLGVVSLSDMEERIYRSIRLLNNETTMEEFSTHDFLKESSLDVKKN